jgi:hypothetical protein
MVNLSEEEKQEWTNVLVEATLKYVYTPETLKAIDESKAIEAARREEEVQQEKRTNELLRGKKGYESLIALYDEFERRNLEEIAELGADIGLMARLREKARDSAARDYARYFINMFGCEMETLYGEIEEYRTFKEELGKLSRA